MEEDTLWWQVRRELSVSDHHSTNRMVQYIEMISLFHLPQHQQDRRKGTPRMDRCAYLSEMCASYCITPLSSCCSRLTLFLSDSPRTVFLRIILRCEGITGARSQWQSALTMCCLNHDKNQSTNTDYRWVIEWHRVTKRRSHLKSLQQGLFLQHMVSIKQIGPGCHVRVEPDLKISKFSHGLL